MVVLALAALIPNLILMALWLGLVGGGFSRAQPEPAPQAAPPAAVLTAPVRIETIAGKGSNLPMAIDGTDGVPPRSVVAIKGLPPGAKLSDGRPYGEGEWTLRPDQIGDLTLVVPAEAQGEFKLGMAILAPDDTVVAEAETLLEITPAPMASEQASLAETGLSPEAAALPASSAATNLSATAAPDETSEPGEMAAVIEPETAPSSPALAGESELAAAPSSGSSSASPRPMEVGNGDLDTVEPSVFVNLRDGPSSQASVIGVIAKGAELSVLDRKRGWVQVTDPTTAKKGWIYSGLLVGEAKPHTRRRRAAPADADSGSATESFWGRVGRWLTPG